MPPGAVRGGRGAVAVVLAGGRSLRYGADKVAVLLDPCLDTLPARWPVVCVGPSRPTARPVAWAHESPPYGGPLAGLAAGVAAEPGAAAYVVVGADMPGAGLAAEALLTAAGVGAAVLVDDTGVRQPLASAWSGPLLRERLAALAAEGPLAGRPLRALLEGLPPDAIVEVADSWGAARDVDTPG
jgi:molybdopterin-guanine dinucleotide biosynthesis protein A